MGTTKTTNSSSTPTFTADQSGLQSQLAQVLGQNISSGGVTPQLQAQQSASVGNTNNMYAGLSQQLQTSLSGRGFGNSGAAVTGQRNLDVSRINDLGTTGSQFAGLAQQNLLSSEGLANQFSFADPGNKSTQTQSTGGLGTILGPLLQAGGLAFGLASGGSGGGLLGGLSGLFKGGGGAGTDDSSGAGYGGYDGNS